MNTYKISKTKLKILESTTIDNLQQASLKLSKLLQQNVQLSTSSTGIIDPGKLYEQFANPEDLVTATYIRILNLEGAILFIFNQNQALKLRSDLKEITNILAGLTLAGLSKLSQTTLHHSLPDITSNMFKAIFDEVSGSFAQTSQNVFTLTFNLTLKPLNITGKVFLLLTPQSVSLLLGHL